MREAPDQERDERVVPDSAQLEAAASALLAMLDRQGWTLATAESCTGGFLSSLLTDVEGLSHCLDRGYVCYSVAAKHDMLGIDPGLIDAHGAVSELVARALAENSLCLADSQLSLAITGFAGPADPEESEGAGVAHIGVAVPDQSWVYRVDYGERPRRDIRNMVTLAALAIGLRTAKDRSEL
jgi:nicotinamide-nucleotide amidase